MIRIISICICIIPFIQKFILLSNIPKPCKLNKENEVPNSQDKYIYYFVIHYFIHLMNTTSFIYYILIFQININRSMYYLTGTAVTL